MPFRNADLGTRTGALSAAQQGTLGCLLLGGLTIAAGVLSSDILLSSDVATVGLALIGLLVVMCLVAAYRLWHGRGLYWAVAVLVFGVILAVGMFSIKPESYEYIVIGVLLLTVAQGIRGAQALRRLDAGAAGTAE